jgi:AraC-like DNA-binding protein
VAGSIPAIHAVHFLALLERWQVDTDALVNELGLSRDALAQPGARISIDVAERVIERGCELSGERHLGFFFGLQMRISAHGYLGFAAMTSPTARDALELACRFAPTHTDALKLTLQTVDDLTVLRVEEAVPLGGAREVILTALFVGIWQMAQAATGRALSGETELMFEEPPDYRERFVHLTPRPIRFGRPHNQLSIESAALSVPLLMADPAAQKLAREQCERELQALAREPSVVERVRGFLREEGGLGLGVGDVAKRLHMSERTLKRRLMGEGTSFVELLDAERRALSMELLRTTTLSLEEVAERAGYTELSNFTRAFRRWTGTTPARFRQSLR